MTLCGAKTTEQGLLGSVQILRDPLRGRGGSHLKDHKRSQGGRGGSPKDHRGSRSQEGGGH